MLPKCSGTELHIKKLICMHMHKHNVPPECCKPGNYENLCGHYINDPDFGVVLL